MLQYDQSGLKKHAQAAREGLETLINQIDELAKAPFVETIASELRATQVAAERALKEVETAERYLQNYDDRINNRPGNREVADTLIHAIDPITLTKSFAELEHGT